MKTNEQKEKRLPILFTLLFGLLAATIGTLALLGWILGVPVLASFSSGLIPMAPSTAILFISFGAAILLRTRFPKSSWFYNTGIIIGSISTLIALLLFLLSSFGIHLAVEHLGFKIEGSITGAPFGYISPLTALCFVLAGLSFLISLSSSEQRKQMLVALSFAFLVILVSIILLLAHLFGTPLLYGTQFIPPALSTSLAFFFLGTALLAFISPKVWQYKSETDAASTRSSIILIFVFVVLSVGIISAGYFYYKHNEKEFRLGKEREISFVADLKINVLTHIRKGWVENASLFYENTVFSTLVDRYFNNPKDIEAHRQLRTWLSQFKIVNQYNNLCLHDAKGIERFALPDLPEPHSSTYKDKISEAIKSGKITIADFYRNEYDQHIYLNIFVPILDPKNNSRVNGVLSLRIDPESYLYPYIKSWPTQSKTSETILVRREGDDVLYLNEVKLKQNTALSLRIPLKNKTVMEVRAVLGEEGIVEGYDYRDIPVLAYIHHIPNSPWFIITKMDFAEVYAPLRERLWLMIFLITALLFGSGTSVAVVWRQQRVRFYKERYSDVEHIQKLNRVYALLSNINKAIVRVHDIDRLFNDICRIAIEDGKFLMAWIGMVNTDSKKVEVVASAGFTSDYLAKINIDLNDEKRSQGPTGRTIISGSHFISNNIEHDESMIPWREDALKLGYRSSASFPIKVFGKVSGVFNMYSSEVGFFDKDEIKLLDELAMDISFALEFIEREAQRKRTEEALQESEEGFRRLFEESTDPILLLNQKCFFNCNPAALSILQLKSKDEIGNKTPWDLSPEFQPDGKLSSEKAVEMISTAKQNGYHRFEWVHTKKDGTNFFVEVMLTPIALHGEEIFHVIWRDITERKRAEEALVKSEEKHRRLVENLGKEYFFYRHDTDGVFSYVSPSVTEMLGYSEQEFLTHHTKYQTDNSINKEAVRHTELSIKGQQQTPYEVEIYHKDGSIRWLEVTELPLRDDNGKVNAVEGIAKDITERKLAEEELHRKEEHHKAVIENIFKFVPEGVLVLTESLNLLKHNKAFDDIVQKYAPLLGYTEEGLAEKITEQLRSKIVTGDAAEIRIMKKNLIQDRNTNKE
ncbi:MAG: PAS domain S-box protein [Melioribacteraceae bacterium]